MSEREPSADQLYSIPCMWMRAGTSKGGFFLAQDLPSGIMARDAFLLSIMGSPDLRQIDGMGGADPLTSKVAVVKKSTRDGVDVDYLFLQVMVDQAIVSDVQNCGNMLAGVGPFAIERGLLVANDGQTPVTILWKTPARLRLPQWKHLTEISAIQVRQVLTACPDHLAQLQSSSVIQQVQAVVHYCPPAMWWIKSMVSKLPLLITVCLASFSKHLT